jgi:type I restriction enzyme S subunit
MDVKPGYKQTDVGMIPVDWDFGNLAKYWTVTDCKHVTAEFINNGIPVASIREVQSKIIDLQNANQTTEQYYNLLIEGGRKPLPGDLIFSRNATVGEIAQVDESHPLFAMGQDVCIFKKKSPEFSTDFLQSLVQSPIITQQLTDLMVGSTFKRVNIGQIKNFKIPMPSASEQRTIATPLSDVDTLITSLDRLIAKKRDIKQAAMQELLNGKRRLSGFDGVWEVKELGDILDYEQPANYIVKDTNYNDNNDIPVLTANKGFILGYTSENDGVYNNIPVIIFDDFMTASKFVDFPFKVKSGAIKFLKTKNKQYNLRFIFEKIQNIHFPVGDHKRYYISEYQFLQISIPKIEEQNAIVSVLSDMDTELKALEQKRDKTKAIKQGMMQELLTGRIRLV